MRKTSPDTVTTNDRVGRHEATPIASTVHNDSLTKADMVLISIARLTNGQNEKAPYEEIVIQAWREFPEAFSLRSHPEHPDASDIHKKIYQTLKPAGLVLALGNKVFRLTDKGLNQAQDLINVIDQVRPSATPVPNRLSRNEQAFLAHSLQSRTFLTWQQGYCDNLIDHDARLFYQFSTATPMTERRRKVSFANETFVKGRMAGVELSDDLSELSAFLSKRFSALLEENQ